MPLEFLLGVVRDPGVDLPLRIAAAKAALPYFAKRGADSETPAAADRDSWSVILGGKAAPK